MGVIAKRPIANAAWRTGRRPADHYHYTYWKRLQKLKYDFLRAPLSEAISTALRFTLSVSGVDTAIVGTTKHDRWRENATMLEAGPLPLDRFETIQARWKEITDTTWEGQI
jgi:aryl-alcohol dehydrogenase-like predicted oxidoreductase